MCSSAILSLWRRGGSSYDKWSWRWGNEGGYCYTDQDDDGRSGVDDGGGIDRGGDMLGSGVRGNGEIIPFREVQGRTLT
ncbi:hypothetical protein L1987_71309 [Smallanthus sonchifolius]|uniref:Uncharacterized protein n=1 Tax=Smallanthus sonchifolius TaxID=185202 RepID=A0ACB9ARP8_9ASTR|nr:hypothetical protein L1987_71309 [Smallanthus sonchifolius]